LNLTHHNPKGVNVGESEKERNEAQEQQAEGMWKQVSGRIQEAWGALTDDDLDRFKGQRDQLVGRIQQKTGETREKVSRKLKEIAEDIGYRFK
jgi:uncharacterized protein YjbJ (UPF0337 family)